jgi:predicted nucleic acid-binding Zn ribbon protein
MSALARRCSRCGDIDKYRIRRAVVKLAMFVVVTVIVVSVALWAGWGRAFH